MCASNTERIAASWWCSWRTPDFKFMSGETLTPEGGMGLRL